MNTVRRPDESGFPKQGRFQRAAVDVIGNEMIRSKGSLATVAFQLFFGARAARSFSAAPLMKTVCVHSSRSLRRTMYRRKAAATATVVLSCVYSMYSWNPVSCIYTSKVLPAQSVVIDLRCANDVCLPAAELGTRKVRTCVHPDNTVCLLYWGCLSPWSDRRGNGR